MARYYPVSPQFWTDPKVKSWDDTTRTLALYVLTCPHRNLEGLFHLPTGYIQANLGWNPSRIEKGMGRLEADGFLALDPISEVVLIRQALKYQQPKSKKQIQGALNVLAEVPPNSLQGEFQQAARQYAPALADALANGLETLSDGVPDEGEAS